MVKIIFYSFILFFNSLGNASEFKLIGSHLLEFSIFKVDVYEISYFKAEGAEKLVLDYKIPVKREHSIEGWKVGLKDKLKQQNYLEKAQWLFDHTYDVKKGDQISIIKRNQTIEIYKNDELLGKVTDPIIAELAFEPWLGERPVDDELKLALLNKKN